MDSANASMVTVPISHSSICTGVRWIIDVANMPGWDMTTSYMARRSRCDSNLQSFAPINARMSDWDNDDAAAAGEEEHPPDDDDDDDDDEGEAVVIVGNIMDEIPPRMQQLATTTGPAMHPAPPASSVPITFV